MRLKDSVTTHTGTPSGTKRETFYRAARKKFVNCFIGPFVNSAKWGWVGLPAGAPEARAWRRDLCVPGVVGPLRPGRGGVSRCRGIIRQMGEGWALLGLPVEVLSEQKGNRFIGTKSWAFYRDKKTIVL